MLGSGNMSVVTRKLKKVYGQSLSGRALCCVYAVGPESGNPIKIGLAENIANRVSGIQTSNWVKLKCHLAAWTPGPAYAKMLEANCHKLLDKASKRISGEWFDINPEWAAKVIAHCAEDLGIKTLSHREMLKKYQRHDEIAKMGDVFWL